MKIVTDSAADMTNEEIAAYDITVAPLQIQFPEGAVNSESISRDNFYNRLKAMWPEIPSTSLPSPGVFTEIYQRLGEAGEQILSIHISSGLSSTIESARVGAKSVPGVQIEHVDTLTLSGGERFQILAAALALRAGKSMEFILERLKQIQVAAETIYTLETLAYLAKGGRIGRVQALAGAVLGVKPIINVDPVDGKYSTIGRERTLPRALQSITNHLSKKYADVDCWVTVLHGQSADYAETLSQMLRASLKVVRLEVMRISPVLGVHTGPGIIGAAVVPFALFSDLDLPPVP